ncbi:DUF99 family protein [Halobaculum lipolyticum]|uniref:UPF0215 protein ACFQL9_09140 n=1 Tax=Halobaculum lipolyticum TaxID=3032001 RepID=A0ABD5WE95_9EURY|nr:DUF99 family protein [Halobaculum sp. DT31]
MTHGSRALGLAVSASDRETPADATVAGAVVGANRAVDGLAFSTCTVGGTDATAAVVDCVERLGREDVRSLLLAGVAPAWFNVVDLAAVRDAVGRPVLAVSFEASAGLEPHLRDHFDGAALERRLTTYRALPERVPVWLDRADGDRAEENRADGDGHPDLWVRAVGVGDDEARRIVRVHTADGRRRPEPLRVAKVAARAGRAYLDDPGPAGADTPGDDGAGRAGGSDAGDG